MSALPHRGRRFLHLGMVPPVPGLPDGCGHPDFKESSV
jgi:hypothetical protein